MEKSQNVHKPKQLREHGKPKKNLKSNMLVEHFKMDITKRHQMFSQAYSGLSKNWEDDSSENDRPVPTLPNLHLRLANLRAKISAEQIKLQLIDATLEPIEAALKKTGNRTLIPTFKRYSS